MRKCLAWVYRASPLIRIATFVARHPSASCHALVLADSTWISPLHHRSFLTRTKISRDPRHTTRNPEHELRDSSKGAPNSRIRKTSWAVGLGKEGAAPTLSLYVFISLYIFCDGVRAYFSNQYEYRIHWIPAQSAHHKDMYLHDVYSWHEEGLLNTVHMPSQRHVTRSSCFWHVAAALIASHCVPLWFLCISSVF